MKQLSLFLTFFFTCSLFLYSQKQPMSFEQMISWERITEQVISDNGDWVACTMEPWRGDSRVLVYNKKGEEVTTISKGEKIAFSPSSGYLILKQTPPLALLEELKLKKTKKDELPTGKLVIYDLKANRIEEVDSIKNYKLSPTDDWLAYQRSSKTDSTLYIRSCDGRKNAAIPNVHEYKFAPKANILCYVASSKTADDKQFSQLYTFQPATGSSTILYEGEGVFTQITFSEKGDKLAFLYCGQKDSVSTSCSLFLSENNQLAQWVTDKSNKAIPVQWVISEHGELSFSKNGERLYFGTAPAPLQKDTTILDDNRPNVQVWNWNEEIQYTQQTVNKKKDANRSYKAVYNVKAKEVIQLASEEIPNLVAPENGDTPQALLSTSKPYGTQRMWRGKNKFDIYLVNQDNGEKQLIKTETFDQMQISPEGKYAWWYCQTDSSWYTLNLTTREEFRVTLPSGLIVWNEDNDMPDYPRSHGVAGWSENDRYLLIYDRYDIWKVDPQNAATPINLTLNGRQKRISYRYVSLDKEEKSIDLNKPAIIRGFNEVTKGYGLYSVRLSTPAVPKKLISGNYILRTLMKAKNADRFVYSLETFEQYPDLYLTDSRFAKPIQLTEGYKQQEGINWGTAELIHFTSLDGQPIEGVLYKPENFDPAKKYPMIVNFYERNAETLHNYRMPEPHRSTIDYHFYTSNGYVVFNPDIWYKDGAPGESCYNIVMPGIKHIVKEGFIDENAIGAQGHSWGGYQVAYLATRTPLFAAIESGAPVVNMYSAYGGIRWETGLSRSFQYEHTQSRIGKTIWEAPLAYHENSPLFTMDKVTTPILIMHNDNDGHVPWYQGIEFFVALKRLQKPVWMLNYPGEVHWPIRLANKIDFQKRMYQFFEYYLRGKEMPVWMKEGIPAVKQEYELGYDLP